MFQENDKIGQYKLIKRLGVGGFGEVWLATKRTLFITKKVAIKLPLEHQIDLESISKEAVLWEQASGHPNVLPIIDADIYDGQIAIVSEYVEGGSLDDKLKTEGKLSWNKTVQMTIGILKGLEYLHKKGIIHRDLKPQNILIQGDTPRIADFGISRAINSSTQSTAGTPAYMAPEAFDGIRDEQTDIWSVGVIIYRMLFGQLPFPQKDMPSLIKAIIFEETEAFPSKTSLSLSIILKKCLAKDINERYKSVSEILEQLQSPVIKFESLVWGNESTNKVPELISKVDPERKPRIQHYAFAHIYLREKLSFSKIFVENINKPNSKFLHSYWSQCAMQYNSSEDEFISPDGLCCYPFTFSSDVYGSLIQFPQPLFMTEAFFVAVIIDEDSEINSRYITLELSANRDGSGKTVLGEWKEGSHLNYGTGPAPNPELFLDKVREIVGF